MAGKRRPETPANPDGKTARRLRWAAVLALVLGAHLLVWLGLLRMPGPLVPLAPDLPVLEAILLPPEPVAVPPPRPAPRATPRPAPPKASPPPEAAPPLATSPGGDAGAATGTGGEGAAPAGPPSVPSPPAPTGPPPGEPALRYAAPPSMTLRYASYVNGVQNPDGNIQWEQGGGRYRLSVETRMLWFRFAFHSEGALDERGLAPERYEEERRKRKQAVRFDRAARTLVFEAAGKQEPLPDGAQDRFSVFLQLVGLVRGNPQRYATPGITETFQVADTRDLEPMRVQYVGEEEVDTGSGFVRARHFIRLPRRADDRRRVEVWLAESVGWMPVKLRQTEPDGTQIDLVLRGG